MGLFDFMKKKSVPAKTPNTTKAETNSFGEPLDRLTSEGELPFGWIYRNKDFVDKINGEYSYFLKLWLDARNKSPREQYSALKSFVLYLEDAEKMCVPKGECFEFWFYNCIAPKDYIEKRKNELKNLVVNYDALQKEYELKTQKEEEKQRKIIEMKSDVILLLKENDGILQSDFWKLFDDEICRSAASDIVYALSKEGKIERTKSGRSYVLHYKE